MAEELPPLIGEAEAFGPLLERWLWPTGELQYLFHCPGCKGTHAYWLAHAKGHDGPIWHFNGNQERPTFTPSLRVQSRNESGDTVCHLFVTDGQIIYCGDSTHELAGKTVPMVSFEGIA